MTLPTYQPGSDPGPNFIKLLASLGYSAPPLDSALRVDAPHGTTIVAIRYADGVLMAGDRRATAGNMIAHRGIEKVFQADRYSGIAISGTVGPAMEMVKLFQTNLEHYEKVEDTALSLEGKANQLEQMIRGNLPMAMQGLVVIPIFAGYDTRRETGRVFTYDVTGGRTEETDFHAAGSGGRDAHGAIKMVWKEGLTRDETVDLSIRALFEAADEDSATGGPDTMRGIYPVVATITKDGYQRIPDEEVAQRSHALIDSRTEGAR